MTTVSTSQAEAQTCALCIVGAGIAGLNALYAAAKYLKPTDTVILVDRKPRAGGMWTDTYDYVRLHQPHAMFTAGDIPWTLNKPPAHLASKQEVLAHFEHCIRVLRKQVNLVEHYGHDYVSHQEVTAGKGWQVEVRFKPLNPGDKPLRVLAQRCVKAFGFQVEKSDPMAYTSQQITSVSTHDSSLLGPQPGNSTSPVYVVGGGKTGMDTAHALLARFPGRKVYLVVGKGTVFWNRNKSYPNSLRGRWTRPLNLQVFADIAQRFDGHNEREVFEHFKRTYALGLGAHFEQYVLGGLSEEENDFIGKGVTEVIEDYVEDVVDAGGHPTMRMRSGVSRAVEPGSVFVNCTGYLMRRERAYEPYLSEHGCVVSVQQTSAIHVLSSYGAYLLVHLLYLGKLKDLPLYEVDVESLTRQNKSLASMTFHTQCMLNVMVIGNVTPPSVLMKNGLDTDRWFPLPRRLMALIRLKRNEARLLAHFRKTLDAVQARTGVRCGVLPQVATQGQPTTLPMKQAA